MAASSLNEPEPDLQEIAQMMTRRTYRGLISGLLLTTSLAVFHPAGAQTPLTLYNGSSLTGWQG